MTTISVVVSGGALGALVSALWWALARRRDNEALERVDIEQGHARDSRGKIRRDMVGEVMDIKTHFVHKRECEKFRDTMGEQVAMFSGNVEKLARVGERADMALERVERVSEQMLSVSEDLGKLAGRLNGRNGK